MYGANFPASTVVMLWAYLLFFAGEYSFAFCLGFFFKINEVAPDSFVK